MPKDTRITVRLSHQLAASLEATCKITGLDISTVCRACLEAYVEHVKAHGEIRLPLAIAAKRDLVKTTMPKTTMPKAASVSVRYSTPRARSRLSPTVKEE
ncbi:MAG: hypothetical protein NTZ46_04545 [Verrucomicrobia bacterium]|nr:hypothetical protein [Verrucomicrobiota bacterium]